MTAGWVNEFRLKGKSQESLAGPYIPSRKENLSGMDLEIIKTFLACFFFFLYIFLCLWLDFEILTSIFLLHWKREQT